MEEMVKFGEEMEREGIFDAQTCMILSRSLRFLPIGNAPLERRFGPLTVRLFLRVKWEFADKPFLYACGGALLNLLIKINDASLAFQFVCLLDSNKGCHKQTYL